MQEVYSNVITDHISIHAPREGSDADSSLDRPMFALFQSTPPARGATVIIVLSAFSITFQSTPPARGATANTGCGDTTKSYFNPRPPRGERRRT